MTLNKSETNTSEGDAKISILSTPQMMDLKSKQQRSWLREFPRLLLNTYASALLQTKTSAGLVMPIPISALITVAEGRLGSRNHPGLAWRGLGC